MKGLRRNERTREATHGPEKPLVSRLLEDLIHDTRNALRGLRRHPGFALIAAITLAVGIGATTSVLSIADAVLFQQPPVRDAGRLASIWELRRGFAFESVEGRPLPYDRYEAYRDATGDLFDGLAGHAYADFSIRTDAGAVAIDGFLTSPNYFDVVGVTPAAGRLYATDDAVVVLSNRLWRSRFDADPGVVGTTVYIDSRAFTVAGIGPEGFTGTMFGFTGDAWIPAMAYRQVTGSSGAAFGGSQTLVVPIGRLADGIDREAGRQRLEAVARMIPPESPSVTVQGARLDPITWREDIVTGVRAFVGILMGAAVLLLLIACTNIAGLVFARAIGRQREVAVRLAIGASRGRVVRQFVTESLLLFAIGGVAGVAVAVWSTRMLSRINVPISASITVDVTPAPGVLVAGLVLAAVTGILFAVGPALRTTRTDLSTTLKEGGVGRVVSSRSRAFFVTAQFAMAVVLLVTAGLFLRSVAAGLDVELGFDPHDVVVATVGLEAHGYDEARGRAFQRELLERVRQSPEVESAALARIVLLGGMNEGNSVRAAEWDPAEREGLSSRQNVVDAAYFETMRVPLLAGRPFLDTDGPDAAIAVINQRLAAQLWPGQNAVGRRIRTGGREYEVVGVARDGRYTFVTEEQSFVFRPLMSEFSPLFSLHVRTRGDVAAVRRTITEAVRALDPNVAVEDFRRMDDVVDLSLFPQRFASGLTGLFAIIGVILATIGVYGVLALHVAQRTREFGIRMALGAGAGDVLRQVLARGLVLAALGSAIGLLLAVAATRLLRSLLFGVAPLDPLTFAAVPATVIAVAVLASVVPARRATRADPLATLRQE